jgi:hypothetical protein
VLVALAILTIVQVWLLVAIQGLQDLLIELQVYDHNLRMVVRLNLPIVEAHHRRDSMIEVARHIVVARHRALRHIAPLPIRRAAALARHIREVARTRRTQVAEMCVADR